VPVILLAIAVVIAISMAGGLLLEGYAARHADRAFASTSARVGPSIEERDFSGTRRD
jgi:hypothetical protein